MTMLPAAIVALCQQLIRQPSESSDPTLTVAACPEAGVFQVLADHCQAAGVSWEPRPALPNRPNFIAHFPRPGAAKLLITGHMDTVSGRGMRDGFSGALRDDRLHGRGACDDKGPLALALGTLLELKRRQIPLTYDVTLAATVDEECSLGGASQLLASLPPWQLCLGLEPTGLRLVAAHKGVFRCQVETTGLAAHASTPDLGRNAILAMHPIISDLYQFGKHLHKQRDPELGPATLAITQIQGGSSTNTIPDRCVITLDLRLLPKQEPGQLAAAIQDLVGIRGMVRDIFAAPGLQTEMRQPLIKSFQNCLAAHGVDPKPTTAAFATDCSMLGQGGPCVIWGPGHIAQAHQVEEFIELKQLESAWRILRQFLTTPAPS